MLLQYLVLFRKKTDIYIFFKIKIKHKTQIENIDLLKRSPPLSLILFVYLRIYFFEEFISK